MTQETPTFLSDKHQRQIAQFVHIAECYLNLASEASEETEDTLGMTKHSFMPGAEVTWKAQRLNIIGAHISSAAIRLASIEDVLKDAGAPRPEYSDCRAHYSGSTRFEDSDKRAQICSDWFHVMLRDNAAQGEPLEAKRREFPRWQIRQGLIEQTTFAEAYSKIREIASQLRTYLEVKHGIVLPTIQL